MRRLAGRLKAPACGPTRLPTASREVDERPDLTPADVSSLLRITPVTVYRLIWAHQIPAERIGRRWRIRRRNIDAWLAAHLSSPDKVRP